MKSFLIFVLQACFIAAITIIGTSEVFLYYKQEIEEMPNQVCENNKEEFGKMPKDTYGNGYEANLNLGCINNITYVISDAGLTILEDDFGDIVLCTKNNVKPEIEGYHLWTKN